MADPPESKELRATDVAAAGTAPTVQVQRTGHDDPQSNGDGEQLHHGHGVDREAIDDDKARNSLDQGPEDVISRKNALNATKSNATDASQLTLAPSTVPPPPSKPWYKQRNPLRWGRIPPVPEERIVSREHDAGFFSKLTFQWMTPLMTVSA